MPPEVVTALLGFIIAGGVKDVIAEFTPGGPKPTAGDWLKVLLATGAGAGLGALGGSALGGAAADTSAAANVGAARAAVGSVPTDFAGAQMVSRAASFNGGTGFPPLPQFTPSIPVTSDRLAFSTSVGESPFTRLPSSIPPPPSINAGASSFFPRPVPSFAPSQAAVNAVPVPPFPMPPLPPSQFNPNVVRIG